MQSNVCVYIELAKHLPHVSQMRDVFLSILLFALMDFLYRDKCWLKTRYFTIHYHTRISAPLAYLMHDFHCRAVYACHNAALLSCKFC